MIETAPLATPSGCSSIGGVGCVVDKVKDLALQPIKGVATDAIGSVTGGAIEQFAQAVAEAVGTTLKSVATIWTQVPNPKLNDGGTAAWLSSHLWFYMSAVAVVGLLIAGARMAWRAHGGEDLRSALKSLLTLAVISAGGIAMVNVALQAGDAYSVWILGDAGGAGFNKRFAGMFNAVTATNGGLGAMLVIVIGVVAIFASLFQVVLMVARSTMLIILAGAWPLSASATNTEWGQSWFKKITAWIVAFVLYKPAAATIYAVAFQMFGNEKGLLGVLMGMAAIVLSVLAMPALMRLCVPMVGGMSEAAGHGAALGLGAVALAARGMGGSGSGGSGPTGAIPVPALANQTGGGGGGGGGGPEGAATTPPAPAPSPPSGAPEGTASPASGEVAAGAGAAGSSAAAAGPAGAAASTVRGAGALGAMGAQHLAQDTTAEGGEVQ